MTVKQSTVRTLQCLVIATLFLGSDHGIAADVKQPLAMADTDIERPKKEKASGARAAKTKQNEKKTPRLLDRDVEHKVLLMVEDHLPEVKVLLKQLRDKKPTQYNAAVRGLARFAKRIELAKKRGEEVLELEVEIVKAQSSINLLIAKLRLKDNPNDRDALRAATEQAQRAQLNRDRQEYAQWHDRLQKLQKQVESMQKRIEKSESSLDSTVNSSFQSNLRKAGIKD